MTSSADLNMILRDLSAFNMGRGAYDTTGVKKPGVLHHRRNKFGNLVILNIAFYTNRSCFVWSGAQQWLEFLSFSFSFDAYAFWSFT